jgi:hypothetical protein
MMPITPKKFRLYRKKTMSGSFAAEHASLKGQVSPQLVQHLVFSMSVGLPCFPSTEQQR